ncbi:MAG: glycosyltransferase, partial [Candidatus Micrarchaeaceae archaeon]
MEMNDANLKISVIITAYNRKDFLLEALKSAVNQTLDRRKYEIICIKNFRNKTIDNYIKMNGIKSIIERNKTIGEYMLIATKEASGSIIAWLDDDDLFSRDKLQRIYDIFSNHDVGFYHNDYLTSDEPADFSKIGLKE